MIQIIKKQKMRLLCIGFILVSIISVGVFMQSCSNDYDGFPNVTTVDSEKANLIVSEYLELQNGQYILTLSEDAALALGISKFDYDRIQKEIFDGNALILECQTKGGQIVLNDPQKNRVNISNTRLKNGSEPTPSGNTFNTTLGQSTEHSAWVPIGATKIEISVLGTCPVTVVSGTISCFGQTIHYSIGGASGGKGTYNLPASNIYVTVTGTTNCSDGARISFTFK
jgi:hypothetical protein